MANEQGKGGVQIRIVLVGVDLVVRKKYSENDDANRDTYNKTNYGGRVFTSSSTLLFCLLALKRTYVNNWRGFDWDIQFSYSASAHRTHRFPIIFVVAGQMKTEVAAAFNIMDNVAAF